MSDWDAQVYHQISEPQFRWGLEVLEGLELKGDETVIDAGCGTGRLTARLLERLPRGKVIALDQSDAMLAKARAGLTDPRVTFLQADLANLELGPVADVVFSTATFHWVMDHDALFRGLHRALKPHGRLHAQCGGFGNLQRHLTLAMKVLGLGDVPYPTHFATAEASVERLTRAGFEGPRAWLKDAPTPFADAASFRTFIEHVTLRTVVAMIGERAPSYLDEVVKASAPDFTLDYVRLELRGIRR
ncbi:MAG: methyltransferase domain-containing protein [Archangiaceae bacterium]|nr:methyltransferase domain-containing protein [Archangiaceae bacterium]